MCGRPTALSVAVEVVDMSGRGEIPDEEADPEGTQVTVGQALYTQAGEPVGTVRGLEEGGVFVSTRGGVEALSIEHARSGHERGEAELVWRCMPRGEVGHIRRTVPDSCPSCGGPREALRYLTED